MTRDQFMSYERIFLDDKDFMFSLQLQVREYTFDFDKVIAAVRSFFAYKVALPKEYGAYTDENDVRKNLLFFLPSHFKREAEKPKPAPQLPAYKANNVEEKPRLPTLAERKQIERDWFASMQRQFKLFKDKNAIDVFMPKLQYREFVNYGLLRESDYMLYIDEAKRHLIEKQRSKRLTAGSIKRNSLTEQINRLETGEMNSGDEDLIKQQAMIESIKELYRAIETLEFKSILTPNGFKD